MKGHEIALQHGVYLVKYMLSHKQYLRVTFGKSKFITSNSRKNFSSISLLIYHKLSFLQSHIILLLAIIQLNLTRKNQLIIIYFIIYFFITHFIFFII